MRLFCLALLLSLSACFGPKIEKPTVTVTGVAVGSVSFTGLEGTIDLDVFNPNGFGVPLSLIEWELSVGSARAVQGRIELSQTIPAKASAPVTASLRISAADALDVGIQLSAGVRTYTLSARFTFKTSLASATVDVVTDGTLL
jgi:LEA14-like dessication related protein